MTQKTQPPIEPIDPLPMISAKEHQVLSSAQFQDELQQHEQRLTQAMLDIYQETHKNEQLSTINSNLLSLLKQVDKLDKRSKLAQSSAHTEKVCPPTPSSPVGDKLLLGEFESAYLDKLEQVFTAHIDLTTDSSLLYVDNITLFERDGGRWVRFDIQALGSDNSDSKQSKTVEVKVRRMVRIKSQSGGDKPVRQPVIRVNLSIGKYKGRADLYLVDQEKQKHALILGRKFIKDIAVIDISKKFIQGAARLPKPK